MIRVRHLSHRFGNRDVLRDVSFRVEPGEIFGFVGPNGAGKTTTIRILSTLLAPTSGRVEIDGLDVEIEPTAVRQRIGYMADHPGIYERVTVGEYLEFFASAYRVSRKDRAATVAAVIELTDLGALRDRLVAELSKGMKQRIQLARTLLHDPKVLILDEPASDLDPRARIEMRDLLLELQRMGKTIFLSSHILAELESICTSVGILERGRLVAVGPVGAIGRALQSGSGGGGPTANRRVRIRYFGSPDALDALLGPGGASSWADRVGAIERPAGSIDDPAAPHSRVLAYAGDERMLGEIVGEIVRAGLLVVGVEPERNELERIFLEVTRGELQ